METLNDTNPFDPSIPHSEKNPMTGGVQWKFKFANGFGASVVRHSFSYGREEGLWELAVLGRNGRLCYDSGITDDVLGYLTEPEVAAVLARIAELSS